MIKKFLFKQFGIESDEQLVKTIENGFEVLIRREEKEQNKRLFIIANPNATSLDDVMIIGNKKVGFIEVLSDKKAKLNTGMILKTIDSIRPMLAMFGKQIPDNDEMIDLFRNSEILKNKAIHFDADLRLRATDLNTKEFMYLSDALAELLKNLKL